MAAPRPIAVAHACRAHRELYATRESLTQHCQPGWNCTNRGWEREREEEGRVCGQFELSSTFHLTNLFTSCQSVVPRYLRWRRPFGPPFAALARRALRSVAQSTVDPCKTWSGFPSGPLQLINPLEPVPPTPLEDFGDPDEKRTQQSAACREASAHPHTFECMTVWPPP